MRDRRTVDELDAAIKRRQSRIRRDATAIAKLEARRKRLLKPPAHKVAVTSDGLCHCAAEPMPHAPHRAQPRYAPAVTAEPKAPADDLDIPAFMRRTPVNAADEAAKAAILAERETKAKAKKKASAERSRLARRGDLKRMPLSGKAAMEAILGEAIYGK
jgi:hypothetical protein